MLTLPTKDKNKPAIWGGGKVDLRKKRRPPENCPSVSLEQHGKTGRGHVGTFLASEVQKVLDPRRRSFVMFSPSPPGSRRKGLTLEERRMVASDLVREALLFLEAE